MKRINYNRLEYKNIEEVSAVAIRKVLEVAKKKITDIKDVAFYKYGPYRLQPLLIFFRDGSVWKVSAKLKVERIR